MRLEIGLETISVIIALLLLGYIIYNWVQNHKSSFHRIKETKVPPTQHPEFPELHQTDPKVISLEDLRAFGYHGLCEREDIDNAIFFINAHSVEAVGMFLKVVPEMLDIIMKSATVMRDINDDIDSGVIPEANIKRRLAVINSALENLIIVTSTLDREIYKVISSESEDHEQFEANTNLVKTFITMTTETVNFVFEYLDLNNVVYQKIVSKELSFREDFSRMSSTFLHVFFCGIMNCITMVESTITVLK